METNVTPINGTAMLPVPSSFVDSAALDVHGKVLYVDRRASGNPLLLSWQERNSALGVQVTIQACDLDEIAKLRATGFRASNDEDSDLRVRQHAMEIIKTASKYGASDIHFMMRGTYSEIQLGINGEIRVLKQVSQAEGEAITRSIFQSLAKGRDNSYKSLEFQNAQISGNDLPPDVRINSSRIIRGPAFPLEQDGGFMTLRLQYDAQARDKSHVQLEQLEYPKKPEGEFLLGKMGFTQKQLEKLQVLMDAPNGMVIFTGPTGSGKTNSIYEILKEIARKKPYKRQITLEDPIEFPMEWAVQLLARGKNDKETGEQFAELVRQALRMAPKIMLVGEMRGPEVVVAGLEGSVTGHNLYSTLHVTDPFMTVERLELMDRRRLDRRIFCDHKVVRGLIGQRLLQKLCPHCSKPLIEDDVIPHRILEALKTWGNINAVRVRGSGCSKCNGGITGRFAVAEIVLTDAELMTDFIQHGTTVARERYRKRSDADPSMLESAINHCLMGRVDPLEVEDSVDLIEAKSKVNGGA